MKLVLPRWVTGRPRELAIAPPMLRAMKPTLPAYAEVSRKSRPGTLAIIEVDADAAFEEWYRLAFEGGFKPAMTQYWLEVIYQCVKLDIQAAISGTPLDPRIAKSPVVIRLKRSVSLALSKHKDDRRDELGKGAGVRAAGKEKMARQVYKKARGFLPFS